MRGKGEQNKTQNENSSKIKSEKQTRSNFLVPSQTKGIFPLRSLRFSTPERKDSSHSWRLWTRRSTTMEGTPISGAASGWRRWRVCDPSLTQNSCGVWVCRGGLKGRGYMELADLPPHDTIIWPSHTKTHPAVRRLRHSLITAVVKHRDGDSLFQLITENSWGKRKLPWGGSCEITRRISL